MKRTTPPIWLLSLAIFLASILPATVSGQNSKLNTVEKFQATGSLTDTVWTDKGFKGRFTTFQFKEGGTLHYRTPEASYTNGTWKQFGNVVFVETNKHYTNLLGIITGNIMKGIAWNQNGDEWEYEMNFIINTNK